MKVFSHLKLFRLACRLQTRGKLITEVKADVNGDGNRSAVYHPCLMVVLNIQIWLLNI